MDKVKIQHGLTSFEHTDDGYKITHNGNMGNTIESVNDNLIAMGLPSIEESKEWINENGGSYIESGNPEYQYTFEFYRTIGIF